MSLKAEERMMGDNTTLRIERLIDAPPEAVFRAWTTREAMEQWYCDGDDFVARVTELDVRLGGRYRVEFGPAGQDPYVEIGEYLEIDRPHRLVISETLEGVDSPWTDTRVTVQLVDDDGKTRFTLTHEGFPSPGHRDAAAGGWPGFLDRLESLLS
jgi:uncharacterized protein YndB with AHSA1/START domain